mmetsp:Transcript_22498/g.50366  ORF Transcript_22498/g.50366 Transcript_22498/m.50366 type:complete len:387 (+) Transcript_22498:550-1710(+)
MAHAVELALDVLLRNLEEPEHGVVSLLAHEVQDATILLGRELAPSLLHTRSEVLRTILPIQELNINIELLLCAIVHAGAGEDSHHLAEFYATPCKLCDVVLEALEVLLIDLLVKLLVNGIHVLFLALVVLGPLPLQLPEVVAALANIHVMGRTFHSEAVDLVPKLVNIALGFATGTLKAADAQVQGVEALGTFLGDIGMVPLNTVDAIIDLLVQIIVLLPEVCLHLAEACLQVRVARVQLRAELRVHLCMLVGSALKRSGVLNPLFYALVQGGVAVVHVALVVLLVAIHLVVELLELASNLIQRLVHLAAAAVHLQAQGRSHVAHCLHRSIDVVIHVVPLDDIRLRVQLCLSLLPGLGNVLRELVASLMSLLEALRNVLHPSIVCL